MMLSPCRSIVFSFRCSKQAEKKLQRFPSGGHRLARTVTKICDERSFRCLAQRQTTERNHARPCYNFQQCAHLHFLYPEVLIKRYSNHAREAPLSGR